jgi:hypothetical protein
MKRKDEVAWGAIMLMLLFMAAVVGGVAEASDRITQSNDMNNQTAGNVNTGGNTSKALGLSGGDVDIAQCYRSYSYLIIWQDTKPNPLCLAQQLMAEGNYEAAATLRCRPRTVWQAFGSRAACVEALARAPITNETPVAAESVDDDDEDYHEEQEELYADLLAKIENLEEEVNRPPPPPVQRTIVEQHSGLTDEQKAALREVVK